MLKSILVLFAASTATMAHATTSMENRKDQAVQLMVGSYGYSVGLLTSDNRIVEFGYSGLEVDRKKEGEVNDEEDRWSQSLFLHSKFFHGNSFHTTWGVSWEDSGFGDTPYHQSERSMAFLDGALGNQWCWRHFTLGADWVGVSVPVFERVRVSKEGDATDEGRRTRIATREWHGVDVHYLTLYAGLAF